jgi:hypothetical protein
MMSEPRRPQPADGTTFTGFDWANIKNEDEFARLEREFRDAIRNRSQRDFG